MKCIKINSIEYGWFEARMGSLLIEASDFLGYDMPKKLLEKVLRLVKGKSVEEWLYLMNEPGAGMLKISFHGQQILFEYFELSKCSYDLDTSEEDEKDNCGECIGSVVMKVQQAVDELVAEFSLYENGNGRKLYEMHWMSFPVKEYEELKAVAFGLDKKAGEYDGLFCVSYLEK